LNANDNRIVAQIFTDRIIKLDGRYSIIGRSIVIHRNADDFGRGTNEDSKRTGNAGDRVACATITTSNVLASQASPGQGPPPPQSQTPQRPSSPAPAPPSSGSTKAKIKWPIRAVALLSGAGVSGMVNFTQDNPRALVKIDVNIRGLKAGQQHGFHVHEFGVTDSCASAGGIFSFYKGFYT
jgi:Cu/Zn superoxide dismutase